MERCRVLECMRTTEVIEDFAEISKIVDVGVISKLFAMTEQKLEDANCDFKRK